jgi:hypothetical protein
MNAPTVTLAERAEAAIRRLRDVEGVSVRADGDEIVEIHVLTSADRPPKNIVRDVQTVLRTGLGLAIDHRVVSVAMAQKGSGAAPPVLEPFPPPAALEAPAPLGEEDEEAAPATGERILFEGVNLFVSGPRTQAQVELRWKGMPRIGSATGWSARDEAHRLVAQAAASAVQEFLSDPVALNVQGVEFATFGRHRVALVAISFLAQRQEKLLTGSCPIDQDTPQSVVLATLDALNRVVGGLRVKEPTEYVLRPTTS